MLTTGNIIVLVVLVVVVVIGCRYMWNLKQEMVALRDESKHFITIEMLEAHIASTDRKTLQDAIKHFAMLRTCGSSGGGAQQPGHESASSSSGSGPAAPASYPSSSSTGPSS
jgi:hypothetical protein